MSALARFITLVFVAMLVIVAPASAQVRDESVDRLIAQDDALGAGCNEIALARPADAPLAPDTAWIDAHTACIGDDIRLQMYCDRQLTDGKEYALCMLMGLSDGTAFVDCNDFMARTAEGPFGVDRTVSDYFAALARSDMDAANIAGSDYVDSCTQGVTLVELRVAVVVFTLPDTGEPIGVSVFLGEHSSVAFVVEDAAYVAF